MSEREQVLPVRNDGSRPLTVVLEPWGMRHVVAPGEQVLVVARGPSGGELEVERGTDEIVVHGWSESRVAVVRDDPPRARSAYECRLYIELNPHDCGESTFRARSAVTRTDHGLVATYEGACPRCDKPRRFEFILDDHPTPPAPAFGGPSPSTLIDPGQFLVAASAAASRVPAEVETDDQLAIAAAAIDEVLKFIPPGQDRVPASAFTSAQGKAVYQKEPGRFDRARLEAVLATYRGPNAGAAHRARGTQLAKDLLEGMDAPEDPARTAQHEEHDRRNAELLEVYYVRTGQQPATARTAAEMEFAMRLEPCPRCGSREPGNFALRGSGTAWTLDSLCSKCGDPRTMAFATKGDPHDATHPADELGRGPSLLIKKETFEAELARVLPQVDRDPVGLRQAILCVSELIKLLRPGAELDKLLVQHATLLAMRG